MMKVIEAYKDIVKEPATGGNSLFPVFLKLENLRVLLVGGGYVGLEKLSAIIANAPQTSITVVAKEISESIQKLAALHPKITLLQKPFEEGDLDEKDIVFVAVNDKEISRAIREIATEKKLLVNVADTPDLCDFYLGSIVQKGALKIGISTNGKSPTVAKRVKEVIGEMIPDEIDGLLQNISVIREGMSGSFDEKVAQLNALTATLVSKQLTLDEAKEPEQKRWSQIVKFCLFAFFFMIVGHAILSYVPFAKILGVIATIPEHITTKSFLLMLLTGFMAQMVDGSMGLGYGTISTTFLLANGVNPAIVSSRVHSARVFSSGISG